MPHGLARAADLYEHADEEYKYLFDKQVILREGSMTKHDRGGSTSKPHFFLTPTHLIMTELTTLSRKIKFRQIFKLTDIRLTMNGPKMLIETEIKSFHVEALQVSDTMQWHHLLERSVASARSNANLPSNYESTLNFSALWVEDTPNCNDCNLRFSLLVRRHHCRNCGKCVCGSCCFEKVRLESVDATKLQKVCNACAEIFKAKRTERSGRGGYGAAAY
jgi:hypothetical protein